MTLLKTNCNVFLIFIQNVISSVRFQIKTTWHLSIFREATILNSIGMSKTVKKNDMNFMENIIGDISFYMNLLILGKINIDWFIVWHTQKYWPIQNNIDQACNISTFSNIFIMNSIFWLKYCKLSFDILEPKKYLYLCWRIINNAKWIPMYWFYMHDLKHSCILAPKELFL